MNLNLSGKYGQSQLQILDFNQFHTLWNAEELGEGAVETNGEEQNVQNLTNQGGKGGIDGGWKTITDHKTMNHFHLKDT